MLPKSLLLLASAVLSVATPVRRQRPGCNVPVLPANGGARELQSPPNGTRPKHIALGIGIQNYTCAAVGSDAVAAGALAMLYDITALYPGQGPSSLSQEAFDALTGTALRSVTVPLNFDTASTDPRVDPSSPGASLTTPFPADAPLQLDGLPPLPFLGHHFFNTASVPTFVLDGGAVNFLGAKKDGITAPTSADAGPQGTGAVDWLYLTAATGAVGASSVYRVETAGGVSHGCASAAGKDSTTYAAAYWFFE